MCVRKRNSSAKKTKINKKNYMTVFRFINLKTKLFSLKTIGHRENRDVAQQNRKQSVLSDIYYFLNNICNMTIILQILFQKNNIC